MPLKPVGDILVGFHMGAVDECHHDIVHAGLHLHGDFREALHDRGASVGCLAIRESQIGRPADGFAEHDLAVNHDHQRALILHRAGVQAHRKVVDIDAILPVGWKIVLEPHAAARARRQRLVAVLVGCDGVLHIRNARIGIADREFRNVPCGGDVLVEERGGHAQSGRNVVEAVDLDILRQDVLRD